MLWARKTSQLMLVHGPLVHAAQAGRAWVTAQSVLVQSQVLSSCQHLTRSAASRFVEFGPVLPVKSPSSRGALWCLSRHDMNSNPPSRLPHRAFPDLGNLQQSKPAMW